MVVGVNVTEEYLTVLTDDWFEVKAIRLVKLDDGTYDLHVRSRDYLEPFVWVEGEA